VQSSPVPITHCNRWRRAYSRPPDVEQFGAQAVAAADAVEPLTKARRSLSRAAQLERVKVTGYPCDSAAAHQIEFEFRVIGYTPTEAKVAAHLGSVGRYNFMGNRAIARWIRCSLRAVQRARAKLEAEDWIRSYLLLAGDRVHGQMKPVRHPQVVREVSRMQRLATMRSTGPIVRPPQRRAQEKQRAQQQQRAAAVVAVPVPQSAEFFDQLAARAPSFLAPVMQGIAQAQRERDAAEKNKPRQPSKASPRELDDELDALDLELQELTVQLSSGRAPPPS